MSDRQAFAVPFRPSDRVLFAGEMAARSRRAPSRVFVVFHRHDGWTHVYRTDERDARTLHLLHARAGDHSAALLGWAREAFALSGGDLAMVA